jgi:hypothetical protein
MDRHVESCNSCAGAVNEYKRLRHSLRQLPRRVPPADLTTSLQVLASHERARRVARLTFASYCASVRDRLRLTVKNLMRPLALPVTGGLAAAVLSFSLFVPDLVAEARHVRCDVPTGLFTAASVKDVSWPIFGEAEIVVDVQVDDQGRLSDYSIVCGGPLLNDESLRRRFESSLLLSQFTPATSFGQPTSGKIRVSFRSSRIDIKG